MVYNMLTPMLLMGLLTLAVGLRMYYTRIGEMKRNRIHPQKVARRHDAAVNFQDTRAADNYSNLFELPVLFYVGTLLALVTGTTGTILVTLAWLFAISRIIHSLIHLTYNTVMHRFSAFVAGFALMIAFWIVLAVQLLA